jgi:Flp pilus assembly secretin CpaC
MNTPSGWIEEVSCQRIALSGQTMLIHTPQFHAGYFSGLIPRALAWLILYCLLFAASSENSAGLEHQVRIEARILEWQVTDSMEFDFVVRYSRNPGAGSVLDMADLILAAQPPLGSAARVFLSGLDTPNGRIDGLIETLETVGSVRTLFKPSSILTSRQVDRIQLNQPDNLGFSSWGANLEHNSRIPFETTKAVGHRLVSVTDYRDTGVGMNVSVDRVEGDLVFLTLHTYVSDLTGFINVGLNNYQEPMRVPTIDGRSIKSRLVIPDRTVFIAGLMKTSSQIERKRGIPWLSEIPYLGSLLSSTRFENEDRELVFLIKPEILTPYRETGALLHQEDVH